MVSLELTRFLEDRYSDGVEKVDFKTVQAYPGFTYVEDLDLYIANQVGNRNKTWHTSITQVSSMQGCKILTPAEFWVLHNFCKENKNLEISTSLFGDHSDEWLDMRIPNYSTRRPLGNMTNTNESLGELVTEKRIKFDKNKGTFNKVNSETGLPKKLIQSGEFDYIPPTNGDDRVAYKWVNAQGRLTFSLQYDKKFKDEDIGYRIAFKPGFHPPDV